jgi:hypothetical protein
VGGPLRHPLPFQTLLIAVAKWVGTLAPTIVFGLYGNSPLILGIGLLCSALDLAYIALLWRVRSQPRPRQDAAVLTGYFSGAS